MKIYFKLKSFPQISETFIVSNLVYAKQKGFNIKIYTDKYLGLENSSQAQLLKTNHIEEDLVQPFHFSKNKFKKLVQIGLALLNFKILRSIYPYYKLKRKKNLSPLATLIQYKNFKKGLLHVHFNNALYPTIVQLSKIKYMNPKCIVTYHGYDAFLDTQQSFQSKYAEFYKKHVVAVTTNSNYLKQEVIKLGVEASLIHVIPIGIDVNQFKGQVKTINSNSEIQLITVGRLVQLKGQIYAVRAVKELISLGYNIKYTLIGEGNYRPILEAEVKKLNLCEHVIFEGSKSQDEIISYLQDSDVFMMPSTYDDVNGRREAFGLVSLEAQASGLPVIGFQSGGFPDTIVEGETGYAVEDRNHIALAEKVKYIIENKDVYQTMSSAAIEHASTFDFKHTTHKYLDLYRKYGE
ncbi:colanic acid/amylovoran biosynthesis glycosyltransferase [Psychroflexus salarius]|uniref:Colanic acid/amylovoran biosynthesis glycosyltransferase n=1 Tax=Psychroflexus salarius TaxID=1155689 RepID=A0A1M4X4J4_9FLAO|nr:glycosyltransferase family 4 protein [Psychroflexus salarius]SHE88396.1 colanic acid/amylovoran biosynthesis glycosyltransferase [Psychroflexus salarius]